MKNQQLINQLTAMKDQLIAGGKYKGVGRILKSGGRRIPSISTFSVKSGEYNYFLSYFGIELRASREFIYQTTKTNRANRYIAHQLIRIKKAKDNPELQGRIAMFCIKRSVSFRVSATNYVMNGGFYKYPTNKVYEVVRKVEKIICKWDDNINFRRVYILKLNGKLRPLGVPSIEGRIVLHMFNNMLTFILMDKISKSQHAYIPGRGVITAWREIINKINKYKFVYETDLKGFFDNISTATIQEQLLSGNVPKQIVYYLDNLTKNTPKIAEEKLDESAVKVKEQAYQKRELNDQVIHDILSPIYGEEWFCSELLWQHIKEDECESVFEGVQLQGALFDSFKPADFGPLTKGVPQGVPVSPLLAILPLHEHYLKQREYVNYADDQIFFGNEQFNIVDNPERGIIHNEDKCGWVKFNGVYSERGLKFLGLRLLEGKILFSETRNKVSEVMTEVFKELEPLANVRQFESLQKDKEYKEIFRELGKAFSGDEEAYLKKVVNRNIFGFVLSCMNIGDGSNARNLLFRSKGMTRIGGDIHRNSFIRKFETLNGSKLPDSLTSSASVYILFDLVKSNFRKSYKK